METLPRLKRHQRALGCLLAAVVVLACVFGVEWLANWWTGVVFPGTQFFYTSNSTHPRIYRLTADNSDEVVRVRIPPDYIEALIPGNHWRGYDIITLTAYLPDMVPERVYDKRDNLVAKDASIMPDEQLLKRLRINLSQSDAGPGDPTGETGYVADPIMYAEKHEIPLQENPYNSYEAYIWGNRMPRTFADEQSTWTDYVPKKDKTYYITCLGMPVSESQCDILFVYGGVLAVDVSITSKNIPNAVTIIQKVSAFLKQATEIHSSNGIF